jgi:DNA (cytosine-5)-methyltransferase 1
MTAYYNEIEPFAAQWLRNLIAAGHIADGVVDERSIRDVAAADVAGFTQAHFFAGIGVWSHALRSAGWADDRPVWTGSLPCQPFSAAGRGRGTADERHLWPEFHRLIAECQPPVVLGEQVASALGRDWLDAVRTDLEGVGYAVGAADLGAASVGAPHIRQRLWWAADAALGGRREQRDALGARQGRHADGGGDASGGVDHAKRERLEGHDGDPNAGGHRAGAARSASAPSLPYKLGGTSPLHGFWRDADWLLCRDGKWRPVEPGTFPLAHGATSRVGRLRAYGNAIVAPLAAEFIAAVMDCQP